MPKKPKKIKCTKCGSKMHSTEWCNSREMPKKQMIEDVKEIMRPYWRELILRSPIAPSSELNRIRENLATTLVESIEVCEVCRNRDNYDDYDSFELPGVCETCQGNGFVIRKGEK